MKLVLFADLHLDAAFAWAGASGAAGRRRREALRRTLLRIADLARREGADALLCAGDLYESERVSADTADFLRKTFADLHPLRVFLAPGNHDWYGPASVYARVAWTPNVHVFKAPRLEPQVLADGVTLWGAAHCQPAQTPGFLSGFTAAGAGTHLALFHGSERASFAHEGAGKVLHAPFDAGEIERAGIRHAFVGHYHRPKDAPRFCYPGNPDPLAFGEDGPRAAVVVSVEPDGTLRTERHAVGETEVHDLVVDASGSTNRHEVRELVRAAVAGCRGVARIRVVGETATDLELGPADFDDLLAEFDASTLRVALRPAHDLGRLAREATVRGEFVRAVQAAGLDPERRRRVLQTGLRALEGRTDLEVP
jgi:DNA repair exonuclease SbcCD nuclease subunit